MELYLLRHGTAAHGAGKDADRPLTAEGKAEVSAVAARARAAGVKPDAILSSPLRRAIETAKLAAAALGYDGKIEQTRALEPERPAEDVWEEIVARAGAEQILLASHQPLMGDLLSWLLNSPYTCAEFKKGALARVDVEPTASRPRGVLVWLITPRLLRS